MSTISRDSLLHVRDFQSESLVIPGWDVVAGSSWAVLGRNGAGKQWLSKLLQHLSPTAFAGAVRTTLRSSELAVCSFEQLQEVFEAELRLAANDWLDYDDTGTSVRELFSELEWERPIIETLGLRPLQDTHYTSLSTGETRRLYLARALVSGVRLLVLDNPFDSLDGATRKQLIDILYDLNQGGLTVIFLVSNRDDIPAWCENLALLTAGTFHVGGRLTGSPAKDLLNRFADGQSQIDLAALPRIRVNAKAYSHTSLVELKRCSVKYGGLYVLRDISLTVSPGQHTLITGENGSGKSTLLSLVTGESPQSFSNSVVLFGRRRGSGESLMDVRRNIGQVGNELHRLYRVPCTVITVAVSGFYDTIGLYGNVSDARVREAMQWLAAFGLSDVAHEDFHALSYGQQRLVLIIRALVKSPPLLVLDEPTQGLDEISRWRVLDVLQRIAEEQLTTIVYVSHRQDEWLPMFSQKVHLERCVTDGSKV